MPLLVGTASAQRAPDVPAVPLLLRLVIVFAATLVVGGILVSVAPRYTDTVTGIAHEQPGRSFLWGLAVAVAFVVAFVVLFVTVVGVVLAIPLAFVLVLVGIVSQALGNLTVGLALVGRGSRRTAPDGSWAKMLFLASLFAATVAAIPILGQIISAAVGTVGVGAMAIHHWDDDRGHRRRSPAAEH